MKNILAFILLGSTMWAATVTFQGKPVELNSEGLKVGDTAPVFYAVDNNLKEVSVGGKSNKVQVIAFVVSLDTGTCKLETIAFNKKISKMKNVEIKIVTKDLPFASGRFCQSNKITNVKTLSDYKDANRALRYGTTISAPAFLEGLFARAIYVVDTNGKIAYKEVVKEIADEPNYSKVLKAVRALTK